MREIPGIYTVSPVYCVGSIIIITCMNLSDWSCSHMHAILTA